MVVPDSSGSSTPAHGTGTPAGAQVFIINLPGEATDYSRMHVQALVRDRKGRVVGRGEATFPEYRPIKTEPCYCYNAYVQVDVHPGS
ncbi:hypothetical protein [Streptosporangium pseudovulgare]|uniref:Uncharacterized protein n=1 Tax=Streptosporangium pseudovulgare TaxID=35765 RepID=A0ABQ2RCS6_9ACTN|nr:hypothetical protein [Streptosporangium pseudovulgare]GGQ25241.1 hypothetical protein GCM10010140_64450 [Streptosporangium pseudovulgare]